MAMVKRYFVCEYVAPVRGCKGEHIILSQGFRTYEMANIECRMMRQNPVNNNKCIMVISREVKAEPVPRRYEAYGEHNFKTAKIYEAYAEYLRCEEW